MGIKVADRIQEANNLPKVERMFQNIWVGECNQKNLKEWKRKTEKRDSENRSLIGSRNREMLLLLLKIEGHLPQAKGCWWPLEAERQRNELSPRVSRRNTVQPTP